MTSQNKSVVQDAPSQGTKSVPTTYVWDVLETRRSNVIELNQATEKRALQRLKSRETHKGVIEAALF